MTMRLLYDPEADIASVELAERAGARRVAVPELDGEVVLLVAAGGEIVGLEVLEASRRLPASAIEGAEIVKVD
jgi:uncharacterized protein YuzE